MRTLPYVLAALLVVGLVGWLAWSAWSSLEGAELSVAGWIALGLGVLLTLALGVGLMTLVFYSSRRGHDDPPPR